jgi:tRNA (cmo5U34)-methyltransferase
MSTANIDWHVWQNPTVAKDFSSRRRRFLPGVEMQLDILRRLVGQVRGGSLAVLDLGCGDGVLLEAILETRPGSFGVGLDGSATMLERAQARFAGKADHPTLLEGDFNSPDWPNRLPVQRFDVVVSGFAIHHSEDDVKRRIYSQVFDLLNPGGVFVNTEHVASASNLGEGLWHRVWAEQETAARRAAGESADIESVIAAHLVSPEKAANRLSPVGTQLQWLREIGFINVDCYWKYLEIAVLAGFK